MVPPEVLGRRGTGVRRWGQARRLPAVLLLSSGARPRRWPWGRHLWLRSVSARPGPANPFTIGRKTKEGSLGCYPGRPVECRRETSSPFIASCSLRGMPSCSLKPVRADVLAGAREKSRRGQGCLYRRMHRARLKPRSRHKKGRAEKPGQVQQGGACDNPHMQRDLVSPPTPHHEGSAAPGRWP